MREAVFSLGKDCCQKGFLKYIVLGLLGGLTYLLPGIGTTAASDFCLHCGEIQIRREIWISFYPFHKRVIFNRHLKRIETGYSLFLGKRSEENHRWELWAKAERLLMWPGKVRREVNKRLYERLPLSPFEDARFLAEFFNREEKKNPDFKKRLSKLLSGAAGTREQTEWSRTLREKYSKLIAESQMGRRVR